MKKAKRTNNINTAIRQATKYDFTYKGFAIDHEEKMIWCWKQPILQFVMAMKNS